MKQLITEFTDSIVEVAKKCVGNENKYPYAYGWLEASLKDLPDTPENRAWLEGEMNKVENKSKIGTNN